MVYVLTDGPSSHHGYFRNHGHLADLLTIDVVDWRQERERKKNAKKTARRREKRRRAG